MGTLTLPNRVIMAPLTRGRATAGGEPTPLMVEYYTQRACAGLLISEATAVSPRGYGWVQAPGIFTMGQARGWRLVTDSVHRAGGRIFLQLWHMGRVTHPDFLGGQLPVAPSAIAAKGESLTPTGKKPFVTPHALTLNEIKATIGDYQNAARLAKEAGFDGVEIHGANGYLVDQFLRDGSNKRTDEYGGSVENRMRFLAQVTETVAGVWGAARVGVRLSPRNPYNDMSDSDPAGTFTAAAEMLSGMGIAYLHAMEPLPGHRLWVPGDRVTLLMRKAFKGVLIANGGFTKALGEEALAKGEADAISYGVPYIANPDLAERFKTDAPLNAPDAATFYSHEAKGYTDYPSLKSKAA